ncbi:MAG: hypothetical protein AB8G11_02375 [Saprospiraceae bacterium]
MSMNPFSSKEFFEVGNRKVYKTKSGWFINNKSKPLQDRIYRASEVDFSKVKCWNKKTKKFINTHYFSPVIYDEECAVPEYNPQWEEYATIAKKKTLLRINYPASYRSYWEEQRRRCYEGYEVGGVRITGIHYFYLNFWRIKSKKVGQKAIPPLFLDMDKEFFDEVEKAQQQGKNLLCVKRRQIGMSEKIGAIGAYFYTFFPHSETVYVGDVDKYSKVGYEKCRSGLDSMSRFSDFAAAPEFAKRTSINNDKLIKSGFDFFGKKVGYLSSIHRRNIDNNPQATSGLSPSIAFIDEGGITKILIPLYETGLIPAMEEGGLQGNRIIIIIATGGSMEEGIAQLMRMFYNPEEFNLMSYENEWDRNEDLGYDEKLGKCGLFFPAWKYYVRDYDGNSYKEEGIAIIEHERLKMSGEKLQIHKTQMPLTTEEAFTPSGESVFDLDKLISQRSHLLKSSWKDKVQYGDLEWIMNGNKKIGLKFVPAGNDYLAKNDNGDLKYPFKIFEHPWVPTKEGGQKQITTFMFDEPFYQGLYKGGTDSYDRPNAPSSDSKGSSAIYKSALPETLLSLTSFMPSATYIERPKKRETFFENTVKLHLYYGYAKNLIEYSNITIFDYYKNNNYQYLLTERPKLAYANVKHSKTQNKYGIDPNTKHFWVSAYKEYVFEYAHNIQDLEFIQKLIRFKNNKDYNCDESIAHFLAWLQVINDIKNEATESKNKQESNTILFGYVKKGGKIHQR